MIQKKWELPNSFHWKMNWFVKRHLLLHYVDVLFLVTLFIDSCWSSLLLLFMVCMSLTVHTHPTNVGIGQIKCKDSNKNVYLNKQIIFTRHKRHTQTCELPEEADTVWHHLGILKPLVYLVNNTHFIILCRYVKTVTMIQKHKSFFSLESLRVTRWLRPVVCVLPVKQLQDRQSKTRCLCVWSLINIM